MRPTTCVVAADEPEIAAKIEQPTTLTWSSRPGSRPVQGASPWNSERESFVRNRISPMTMNSGSAKSSWVVRMFQAYCGSSLSSGMLRNSPSIRVPLPCNELLPDARTRCDRAISVDAPAAVLFRWLCQLRVAPYSYDLLDNLGRRSPRELTPGVERLEVGQRFMRIFSLASFAPDAHLTLRAHGVAVTYAVRGHADRCRLVARG